MRAIVKPRVFSGTLRVPASKSHTIRRLLIAGFADAAGTSEIIRPLDSLDTRSCVSVCRALGAEITERREADAALPNPAGADGKRLAALGVRGLGGASGLAVPAGALDVGNSGTTLFLALALASLGREKTGFTGDAQIRSRSAGLLLQALEGLGVHTESAGGYAPLSVRGPWRGGRISISCPTSQYLSALLLAAPLAPANTVTEIDVPLLNERPYVEMTLSCLEAQGITIEKKSDLSFFRVPGGAFYHPLSGPVPADFSSAAFPVCAALAGGGAVTLQGLDPEDIQGDRAIFAFTGQMGAESIWRKDSDGEWEVSVSRGRRLAGGEFDLNDTPDMLPALAAIAAFAEGETRLVNVANARIKECDRIAVMAEGLGKLGVEARELPDGLVIRGSLPRGGRVDSHGDHRVAMAFMALALGAAGPVEIGGAESAAVTWPGFPVILGAEMAEG